MAFRPLGTYRSNSVIPSTEPLTSPQMNNQARKCVKMLTVPKEWKGPIGDIERASFACNAKGLECREIVQLVYAACTEIKRYGLQEPLSKYLSAGERGLPRDILIVNNQPFICMTRTERGDRPLDEEGDGFVQSAITIPQGTVHAVKIIRKDKIAGASVESLVEEIWQSRVAQIRYTLHNIESRVIRSPHAVHLERDFKTDDTFYIIRELCVRDNLYQYLQSGHGQSLDVARRINIGIAFAKSALTILNAGILHLDLKTPHAYPIDNDGRVTIKIGGFGTAKLNNPDCPINLGHGTPEYWPPEKARLPLQGVPVRSHETNQALLEQAPYHDAWSLGIILYELIHPQHELPGFVNRFLGDKPQDINHIATVTNETIRDELESLASLLYAEDAWTNQSIGYVAVIKCLLNVDMLERNTIPQAYDALQKIARNG